MKLTLTGRLTTGQDGLDVDLRDMRILQTGAGSLLYAATGQNGGLSAWRLDRGGALAELAGTTWFSVSGMAMGAMQAVTLYGGDHLILPGAGNSDLLGYGLEPDGSIGALTAIVKGAGGQNAALTSTAREDGAMVLYLADDATGRIAAHVIEPGGATRSFDAGGAGADPGAAILSGAVSLHSVSVGTQNWLLAADAGTQGVSSFRILTGGLLEATARLGAADGLGVAQPTALCTVAAHGQNWGILAAAGSSSLSVLRVGADGSLSATDHLIDTLDTRFGAVQALEVVTVKDHVLVLAGGGDDGLALFTLLPDGQLIHLHSLAHEIGRGLHNVTAIRAAQVGEALQIFVAAQGAAGLSQFTLPLAALGAVIRNAGPGNALLQGTAGSDLILGGDGEDRLSGGAGDDVLVSGPGGGVLIGGAGRDLFVLRPTAGTLHITDYQPGLDRLDLSLFPMLRSPAQITVKTTATGAELILYDSRIRIDSWNGAPLGAEDFWTTARLGTPDRLQVPPFDTGDPTGEPGSEEPPEGEPENVVIHGGPGDDLLSGGSGHDALYGGPGHDILYGGAGDDQLYGGPGDDLLFGGPGNDHLYGGAGNDRLYGGFGEDQLYGGPGDDLLFGGPGADRLYGGLGHDRLYGGAGDDRLYGGFGEDQLYGGPGDDLLFGGPGADRLYGGSGNDRLYGGAGNDRLHGGPGDDILYGGAGQDHLYGGPGDDLMFGGPGNDRLYGGAGNDRLYGGPGDDILTGGPGRDVFVFHADHGHDRITDFVSGTDRIHLFLGASGGDGLGFTTRGDDLVIDTGTGTITLTGLGPDGVVADDFLFL
ncbi:calcium-binding protein [Pontibaca salina]|uniref:Calcium-binding protein n=1 Tax=Pontibaca salina TaxID=2795731 RepID=A0A934HRY4_9RHOB|nr:calcium-binding protein [Pontibaca salina]MBI6630662.1 hypothetical protein [Pontibaca salina]